MSILPPANALSVVYLDNSATTLMSETVINALISWCNRGDAASEYNSSYIIRKMLTTFRQQIAIECGFELNGPNCYEVAFTSGASESNCHIVTSAVRSYAMKTNRLPHIITSNVEHKSLLECCRRLAKEKLCHLTIIPVQISGIKIGAIESSDLLAAIRPNTCLISIIAANHETGILNNIREMSKIAHRSRIPFHTDATQLFGKATVQPIILGIDAFSASFHKLGGPPGVGLLVLRRSLIDGYDLCSHIYGSQNGGLRGGAENLPGIGASFTAFQIAMKDRTLKTNRLQSLKNILKRAIEAQIPCFNIDNYPNDILPSIDGGITAPAKQFKGTPKILQALDNADKTGSTVIIWIEPVNDQLVMPNIILLAVYRRGFCKKEARIALEKNGIIINASCINVPDAMNIPKKLRNGLLRISLSDDTTADDIKKFIVYFLPLCLT